MRKLHLRSHISVQDEHRNDFTFYALSLSLSFPPSLSLSIYIYIPTPCGTGAPSRAMASSFLRFLDHTQRRITVSRTPLDERSPRRRDLYLTTHNRQTSTSPVAFEPTISAGERPQTYALDRAATATGMLYIFCT